LNKLAFAYINLKKPDKAIPYLEKVDSLMRNSSTLDTKRDKDSLFYEAHRLLGDSEKSNFYFKKYQESYNKILSVKKIQEANNIENSFQIKKKELLINTQKGVLENYVVKNKLLVFLIGLGALGFIIFFILNYSRRKKLNKEKAFIEDQYRKLNAKNLELKDKLKEISKTISNSDKETKPLRYKKSSLSEVQKQEYMNLILDYMNTEKPYLVSELTLKELSIKLEISKHHFSEVLNMSFGKNFYGFINLFRVEEAKKIIKNDTNNITMLAIAYDSGFNSKASFNRVFKEITGTTPSEFKRNSSMNIIDI